MKKDAGGLQGGIGLEVWDHIQNPEPPKPRTLTPFAPAPVIPPHCHRTLNFSCKFKREPSGDKSAIEEKKIAKLISFGNQCFRKDINIGFATLFSSRETL